MEPVTASRGCRDRARVTRRNVMAPQAYHPRGVPPSTLQEHLAGDRSEHRVAGRRQLLSNGFSSTTRPTADDDWTENRRLQPTVIGDNPTDRRRRFDRRRIMTDRRLCSGYMTIRSITNDERPSVMTRVWSGESSTTDDELSSDRQRAVIRGTPGDDCEPRSALFQTSIGRRASKDSRKCVPNNGWE